MLPRRQFNKLLDGIEFVSLYLLLISLVSRILVRIQLGLAIGCGLRCKGKVCIKIIK